MLNKLFDFSQIIFKHVRKFGGQGDGVDMGGKTLRIGECALNLEIN